MSSTPEALSPPRDDLTWGISHFGIAQVDKFSSDGYLFYLTSSARFFAIAAQRLIEPPQRNTSWTGAQEVWKFKVRERCLKRDMGGMR